MIDAADVYNGLSVALIITLFGCGWFLLRVAWLTWCDGRRRLTGLLLSMSLLKLALLSRQFDIMEHWLSGQWTGVPTFGAFAFTITALVAISGVVGFVSWPLCRHKGWITMTAVTAAGFVGGLYYSVYFGT